MIGHAFTDPVYLMVLIALFVVSITLHEFGHAVTADLLGDPTPRDSGRVTVNPASHLDPFGSLFLLLAGFGWAKPVPVTPSRMIWPRWGNFLVSAAGPAMNFMLAMLALVALKYGGTWSPGAEMWFAIGFKLNLMLMLFNLLPIPPLDGAHLLETLLPRRWLPAWDQLMPYGIVLLLVLVFWPGGSPLGWIYQGAASFFWDVI